MKNRIYVIGLILFMTKWATAQMRFGIGDSLNASAVVQIDTGDGTRKGLLMPRVALKSTNDFFPLAEHVQGMVVYNTVSAGTTPNNVSPGHYYNDGVKWNRILSEQDMTSIWLNSTTGKPSTNESENIYRSGKIGIGVTTPVEAIDVKGNVKSGNGSNNGYTLIKAGNTTTSGKIEFYNPSNNLAGSIGNDTTNIRYQTTDSTKHHIFEGGRIGISTDNPQVKLEVNGAIKLGNEASTTAAPSAGMIRFNTTTSKFQGFNGTNWIDLHE